MITFGADEGKHDSFSHEEDFKGDDLLKCRDLTYRYYEQKLDELNQAEYYIPYAVPEDFKMGENEYKGHLYVFQ